MKQAKVNRIVSPQRHSEQWQVQQAFRAWAERLDRLPDAAEVRQNKLRNAPPELVVMVF